MSESGVAAVGASAPVQTRMTVTIPLTKLYDHTQMPKETVDSLATPSGDGDYDKITLPLKVPANDKDEFMAPIPDYDAMGQASQYSENNKSTEPS